MSSETPDKKLLEHVEQVDLRRAFADPTSSLWTVVHESDLDSGRSVGRSALFSEVTTRAEIIADGPGWPHGYAGGPAFVEYWGNDERVKEYLPTGNDDGLFPLVITQHFYGMKTDPVPRLVDEFVLFHNLWRDETNGSYIRVLDDGREEAAAFFENTRLLVRTSLIRKFQAARQWDLVLCIDSVRRQLSAPGIDVDAIRVDTTNELENTCLVGGSGFSTGTFTRFFGVRVLAPPSFEHAGSLGFGSRYGQKFPELIVDIDDNGDEVRMACGPNLEPGDFLSSVHFSRDVLRPYYDQPDKYTVDESSVRCGQLWSFRVRGAAPGNLFSNLGDFGEELPEAERVRWAGFNVAPGFPSITDPLRSELANHPLARRGIDHEFVRRYRALSDAWGQSFGWTLFTAPEGDDIHLLSRVRVPLDDGAAEFEEQLSVLARLLVDSLNEKAIVASVGGGESNEKGISKFERLLKAEHLQDVEAIISELRRLQYLRSKLAAHKKSSKTADLVESTFGTADKVAANMTMLIALCEAMQTLEWNC